MTHRVIRLGFEGLWSGDPKVAYHCLCKLCLWTGLPQIHSSRKIFMDVENKSDAGLSLTESLSLQENMVFHNIKKYQ